MNHGSIGLPFHFQNYTLLHVTSTCPVTFSFVIPLSKNLLLYFRAYLLLRRHIIHLVLNSCSFSLSVFQASSSSSLSEVLLQTLNVYLLKNILEFCFCLFLVMFSSTFTIPHNDFCLIFSHQTERYERSRWILIYSIVSKQQQI